jgi:AraC-like DNA-binding protein
MDRLNALLKRFSVSARMFHSGALCGITPIAAQPGLGQLHLIKRGPVRVEHGRRRITIDEPTLLFYPRPLGHRFVTDARVGADLVCAQIEFNGGAINPLVQALPEFVAMPLADLDDTHVVLDVLFREAFEEQCGRQSVIDRLFEVVLINVLRKLMQAGALHEGLLAGMAHPQLAKALVAMHEQPAKAWSLPELASVAGMSRSSFAAVFKQTLGRTPGEYLAAFRLCIAQGMLRRGVAMKHIAEDVGYGSTAALSRAFKSSCGVSPREWKNAEERDRQPAVMNSLHLANPKSRPKAVARRIANAA